MTIRILMAALACGLLTSCAKLGTVISPDLVKSNVASSVKFGIAKYPSALPAVKVGVEVICSQANSTNISPAVIVAAIDSSEFANLKTPEATFIVQGIVTAYTLAWNALGAEAVKNSTVVRPYMQAVCSGGTEGLSGTRALSSGSSDQWPQLK